MSGKARSPELTLWGEPFEDHQKSIPEMFSGSFEDRDVRMIEINGIFWWVGADVCHGMALGNASLAINGNPSRPGEEDGLDDDEKGIYIVNTPGGPQEMLMVNEAGIYALAFKSRKPEAKRFKRWLTHEVLPCLRKYGMYPYRGSPVKREARRLHCDHLTALRRMENKEVNKVSHARIKSQKACRNDYKVWHNSRYLGLTGKDAPALRRALGIKGRRSPLDYSSMLVIVQNSHASALADRMIQDRQMTLAEQGEVVKRITRELADSDVAKFGEGYKIDIRDDPRRGKILDVVRPQISA